MYDTPPPYEPASLCTNWLLSSLPEPEYQRLRPYLKSVSLAAGDTLYEIGDAIPRIYFPDDCMVSLLMASESGHEMEVGSVGAEGMVGVCSILGGSRTNNRALVVVKGEAWQLPASILRTEFDRGGVLHDLMLLYLKPVLSQAYQVSMCSHMHTVEERLSRWLLTARDVTGSNEIAVTHEMLAQLLGSRRAGVTVAANVLRHAGLIDYARGCIQITNVKGLKDCACECYSFIRDEFRASVQAMAERIAAPSASQMMRDQSVELRGKSDEARQKSGALLERTAQLHLKSDALLARGKKAQHKKDNPTNG